MQEHPTPRSLVYNKIAGQSLERIGALSDGIFAIAMTLMVLDIHVPPAAGVMTEADLVVTLGRLGPEFLSFVMSFLTLGIFWTGQQTQLSHFARADRDLAWIHFGFLAVVSLLPFSTRLLAEFLEFRTALLIYWANIGLLGALLYASWSHAEAAALVKPDAPADLSHAIRRRIGTAQALYAGCAVLCVFSTLASIVAIVLVQLNYAVAPRRRWFGRGPAMAADH